jgi:hypothetical protein
MGVFFNTAKIRIYIGLAKYLCEKFAGNFTCRKHSEHGWEIPANGAPRTDAT